MARQQCNACGGTYDDGLPDAVQYFHACPPLAAFEVRALIAAGRSPLTKAQAGQLATLDASLDDVKTGVTGAQRGDGYLAGLALRRPNHRDENIDPAKLQAASKTPVGAGIASVTADALMKAPGAGVTPIAETVDALE